MSESVARTGVSRLSSAVAILAFTLIVIAGADLRGSQSVECAGWGDCSGWSYLTSGTNTISSLHFAVAVLTAFATLALVALSWLQLRDDRRVMRSAAIALGLIGVQVVAVILPADGSAATWGATIHFAATALLLALAIYLATIPLAGTFRAAVRFAGDRAIIGGSLVTIFVALVSGAYLTAAGNATECGGWPICTSSSGTGLISADAHGLHRLVVLVASVFLVALVARTIRQRPVGRLQATIVGVLVSVFAVEVVVGAFSATGSDTPLISATHFGAAAMSWSLLIGLGLMIPARAATTASTRQLPLREAARDYLRVMKPAIIVLLLITTVGAMLVAGPWPSIWLVLATMLGGALASGGASALNCYIDRDIDPVMARTRKRPLPTGRLTPAQVRNFGLILSALAVIELWLLVNPLAAMLALGGNVFYVVIYTSWLKRATPQNIVIGGAAGAFPPLVGWAAVTGSLSLTALLLFAIVFYWTPPHFWSLALLKARDYERASVPMLPVTHGAQYTRKMILLYSFLLVAITMLVVPAGGAGWLYMTLAIVLGLVFISYAARMYVEGTSRLAWRLFKFSNYYLTLILAAMVVDRFV